MSVEPPLYDVGDVSNRRRRSTARFVAPVIALVLLLTLVGLGLYGAYLFVPTATVSLQPKLIDVGPLSTTVTADPQVAVVDASAGLIPATPLQVPIQSTGTFPATGVDVTTTAATGAVRFSSKNTVFEVPVPAGTVVSTANGIDFETTKSVTVPRANFDTHQPGTAMADVVAQADGDRGNVAGQCDQEAAAVADLGPAQRAQPGGNEWRRANGGAGRQPGRLRRGGGPTNGRPDHPAGDGCWLTPTRRPTA